jgi:hypothetical protein
MPRDHEPSTTFTPSEREQIIKVAKMEADGVKPKSDTVKVFVLDYAVLVLTNQSESRFPVEEAIRKPGRCGSAADTSAAGCADNTCPTARGGRLGCCAPSNSSYPPRRQEA